MVTCSFEEISLITATKDNQEGYKTTDESHYPLGLACLHSYLESFGHSVSTLFLNNRPFAECERVLLEHIAATAPDIVGFQILTPNRHSSFCLIEKIHREWPEISLVCGGIHTTILYSQIVKRFPYVTAVLGEGEITFAELAGVLPCVPDTLKEVDGIAFWNNGEVSVTRPRALIADLDSLPFPRHDLFFTDKHEYGCIMTARGCPFACSFCSLDRLSLRKVRLRSVQNVMAEIDWMVATFPHLRKIWIHDDTFFIDNKRVIAICDELIRRDYRLEFVCSGRVKPVCREMVEKMAAAGFTRVMFGLESGHNGILAGCHKNITQEDVLQTFRLFADSPIDLKVFLIVGLPGENTETVEETIRFVKQLQRIKYFIVEGAAILTVYPGTEVYEIMKSHGMIDDDFWLGDGMTPLFTVENSQEQLFAFQERIADALNLNRFLTVRGMREQYAMFPAIIRHTIAGRAVMKSTVYQMLKPVMPCWLENSLRCIFRAIRG
jgi:radical SAM superfamily enzyme YgiQ (UPF0313 family)